MQETLQWCLAANSRLDSSSVFMRVNLEILTYNNQ